MSSNSEIRNIRNVPERRSKIGLWIIIFVLAVLAFCLTVLTFRNTIDFVLLLIALSCWTIVIQLISHREYVHDYLTGSQVEFEGVITSKREYEEEVYQSRTFYPTGRVWKYNICVSGTCIDVNYGMYQAVQKGDRVFVRKPKFSSKPREIKILKKLQP